MKKTKYVENTVCNPNELKKNLVQQQQNKKYVHSAQYSLEPYGNSNKTTQVYLVPHF